MRKNINLLSQNTESDFVYCRGQYYKKAYFEKSANGKFENIDIKLPTLVDDYLRQSYGDISVEPSLNEQVSHHFVYNFDIEKVKDL